MECKTCFGEGGITAENFGDVQSFECPDCKGTGTVEEDIAEFNEITEESFKVWSDFWSDDECLKNVVHQFGVESLKDDVLFYIRAVEHFKNRMEVVQRQRDEAVKALEKFRDDNSPGDFYYGGVHDEANEALERIKGLAQAEGHQSTESAQAQAGGRIGGSHE